MTILSKYELHEELGRGGFAIVYRAVDTRLNREVALKVLNASLGEDPRFIRQFLREAQTAATLKHPNIVVIHEADEAGGRLYLAMELLPGLDLRQRVERDGPLPFLLVVSVIEQMASALGYAHGRGLVHRDVKSANIIVDDAGHATLTDFGLVRAVEGSTYGSSLSLSGGFAGTVEYMSPEQADGQPATAKSDLYGIAIVAYEMVTGHVPFTADTPVAVARLQADKPAPDPRGLRPELPEGMRTAILTALAKKPADRLADAAAFARELRRGLEAEQSRRKAGPALQGAGANPSHGTGWWPATLSARWRLFGLWALGLAAVASVVTVFGLLINNLNVSQNLAATHAAMPRTSAMASAAAAMVASLTTTSTILRSSDTPTPVPPTATPVPPTSSATSAPTLTPTESPTVPAAPAPLNEFSTALFHDDFEHGYQAGSPIGPDWQVVDSGDGNHVLVVQKVDDHTYVDAPFGQSTWQDYRLFLRAKLPESGHPSLYVCIRILAGIDGSRRYCLSFNLDGLLYFSKRDFGRDDLLIASAPLSLKGNEWYALDMAVGGARIAVAVNEQKIFDYTDENSPIPQGYLSLFAFDSHTFNNVTLLGGATSILVDDITVFGRNRGQ